MARKKLNPSVVPIEHNLLPCSLHLTEQVVLLKGFGIEVQNDINEPGNTSYGDCLNMRYSKVFLLGIKTLTRWKGGGIGIYGCSLITAARTGTSTKTAAEFLTFRFPFSYLYNSCASFLSFVFKAA